MRSPVHSTHTGRRTAHAADMMDTPAAGRLARMQAAVVQGPRCTRQQAGMPLRGDDDSTHAPCLRTAWTRRSTGLPWRCARPAPGRCAFTFLDKNRCHIGESQSKRPPQRTQRPPHLSVRRCDHLVSRGVVQHLHATRGPACRQRDGAMEEPCPGRHRAQSPATQRKMDYRNWKIDYRTRRSPPPWTRPAGGACTVAPQC